MAAAIFEFTDSIPGATVGRALQRVDSKACVLVSEVQLTVFPGLSGTVVTTCSITGVPPAPLLRWRQLAPPEPLGWAHGHAAASLDGPGL
jgi:hypothetical protein